MKLEVRPDDELWWRKRAWLFPVTYLVHIVEEYLAAGGFPAWASRLTGLNLTPAKFLVISGVALAVMLVLSTITFVSSSFSWLVAAFGTIAVVNGILHVVTSAITRSYSPGVLSGLVLWVPLGGLVLYRSRQWLPAKVFLTAILLGLLSHGILIAVAVRVARSPL